MGFLTRTPTSNEVPNLTEENPWGSPNENYDDKAVLLNGDGKRCCVCQRVVLNRHIRYSEHRIPYCPDCFIRTDE